VARVTADGKIIDKTRQATSLAGPGAVVEQIADMVMALGGQNRAVAMGVSVPAVLSDERGDVVRWAPNLPGWTDVPLRDMLRERFNLPVFLEYDGHAAVLGEWWVGAGRGYSDVATVIIGTGIGGGMIADGRLWRGRDRLAGAVGWFPLMGPDGVDHWENLASGPSIARRALSLLRKGELSSALITQDLTARDVFESARTGDPLACFVVAEVASIIGCGVANVISMANPEIVILGGSVGQHSALLLPAIREAVMRWAQPISAQGVAIVSSQLGEEAGLLGAAYAAYLRLANSLPSI
jgi:glucokinase